MSGVRKRMGDTFLFTGEIKGRRGREK